jgi:hypothetical protein
MGVEVTREQPAFHLKESSRSGCRAPPCVFLFMARCMPSGMLYKNSLTITSSSSFIAIENSVSQRTEQGSTKES